MTWYLWYVFYDIATPARDVSNAEGVNCIRSLVIEFLSFFFFFVFHHFIQLSQFFPTEKLTVVRNPRLVQDWWLITVKQNSYNQKKDGLYSAISLTKLRPTTKLCPPTASRD